MDTSKLNFESALETIESYVNADYPADYFTLAERRRLARAVDKIDQRLNPPITVYGHCDTINTPSS